MILRLLKNEEKEILKDFLYEAIFIPEGVEPPDRAIINQPENEEEFIMVNEL